MPEMLGTNNSFEACSTAVILRTFMEQLLPLFLVVGTAGLRGSKKKKVTKDDAFVFYQQEWLKGG